MAYFDTTRPSTGLSTGIASTLHTVFAKFATWNDARLTRKSLSKLTARELADIGLTYGDIDMVARRTS